MTLTKMNTTDAFNRIVEINKNNGWLNPVLEPYNNENLKDIYFFIKVDDFLDIESENEIKVFKISKRWGEIIIYCRIV